MSSALKRKKKKNNYGFTKQEQMGLDKHNAKYSRTDRMIKEIFKHIQYMGYMALRDRYGFGRKRLIRFWDSLWGVFHKYEEGEYTSEMLLEYCAVKKLDVHGWMHTIPLSWKLYLGNSKQYKQSGREAVLVLDSALLVYGMMSGIVLKEVFDFSAPKVQEFWNHISYYIDSYYRGYLTDDMINSIMKDECGLDIENGLSGVKETTEE